MASFTIQIKELDATINTILGDSPSAYVAGICDLVLAAQNPTPIQAVLEQFQILQSDLDKAMNGVLQLEGVGKAWKQGDVVQQVLRFATNMLDELEFYASMGMDELQEAKSKREFMFQH